MVSHGAPSHNVDKAYSSTSAQIVLLDLPEEILVAIMVESGPASAVQLAQSCSQIHALFLENSTWMRFLEVHGLLEATEIEPHMAKKIALEHYCRSCDSIKSGVQMFYTGNVCIACEYKNPDNQVWLDTPAA